MTVAKALEMILQAGSVAEAGGKLKLAFPEGMRADLQPAIDALRGNKAEALAQVAQLQSEELAYAGIVLKNAGIRIMALEGDTTIGVWSDLDGPKIRAALHTFGADGLPVRYLDGPDIPVRYKIRRVDGEPVPENVRIEMEKHSTEPWAVRDRLLAAMGWCPKGIPWAEWKAERLNQLFLEQGSAGELGCITAKTVRHGEGSATRVRARPDSQR